MCTQIAIITSNGKSGGSTATQLLTDEFQGVRLYGGKAIRLVGLLCTPEAIDMEKIHSLNLDSELQAALQSFHEKGLTSPEGLYKELLENPQSFILAEIPEKILDCIRMPEFIGSESFQQLQSHLQEYNTNLDLQIDYATLCAMVEIAKEDKQLCFVESKSLSGIIKNFRDGLAIPDGWHDLLSQIDGITHTVFLESSLETRARRSIGSKASHGESRLNLAESEAAVPKEMGFLAKRTYVDALRYARVYGIRYPISIQEQKYALASAEYPQQVEEIMSVPITDAQEIHDFVINTEAITALQVAQEIKEILRLSQEVPIEIVTLHQSSAMPTIQ